MMTDMTWNEFCELYYDTAKDYAEIHIRSLCKKLGELDKRVDLDYVRDSAVLSSLEKAYAHYDAKRGAKITTYLSTLVHNEVVDLATKESKKAAVQQDIDEVKTAIRAYADDDSAEARQRLIPRLKEAIAKLSPGDQVILNYYLEDKSSYIARSVEALHVSENYVSVRRNRIFALLPKLMEMTRGDYRRYCYEETVFAGFIVRDEAPVRIDMPNPILPSLDLDWMARAVLA